MESTTNDLQFQLQEGSTSEISKGKPAFNRNSTHNTPLISRKNPLSRIRTFNTRNTGSRSGSSLSLNGGASQNGSRQMGNYVPTTSTERRPSIFDEAQKMASIIKSEIEKTSNTSSSDSVESKDTATHLKNDDGNLRSDDDTRSQASDSTVGEMRKYVPLKNRDIIKTPMDEARDVFSESFNEVSEKLSNRAKTGSFTSMPYGKLPLKDKAAFSVSQERLHKMQNASSEFGIKKLSKFKDSNNKHLQSKSGSIHAFTSSLTKLNRKPNKMKQTSELGSPESSTRYSSYSMEGLEEKMERMSFVTTNKRGVFTVDSESMKILTANHNAHSILDYEDQGLIGLAFGNLLPDKRSQFLVDAALLKISGTEDNSLILDGTLLDVKSKGGKIRTLSIWINLVVKANEKGAGGLSKTVIVVVEPVDEIKGCITIDDHENILDMDPILEKLFSFQSAKGIPFSRIIPSLPVSLLKEVRDLANGVDTWFYATSNDTSSSPKTPATPATNVSSYKPDEQCFPMIIRLLLDEVHPTKQYSVETFNLQIDCPMHLGGIMNIRSDGMIEQGNTTFTSNFFGYSIEDLEGKPISTLLIDFARIMAQAARSMDDATTAYSQFDNSTIYNSNGSLTEGGAESIGRELSQKSLKNIESIESSQPLASHKSERLSTHDSTGSNSGPLEIIPGTYEMISQHFDGGCFPVMVQVKEVMLTEDATEYSFALWISLANNSRLEEIFDVMNAENEVEEAGDLGNTKILSNQNIMLSEHGTPSVDLASIYDIGEVLGQGSYGCVNLACRKSDGQIVSIKSICKTKLIKEFFDEKTNVPKEVMTLRACNHPNIIKFHDSCESPDKHFIIMEYFGESVDLFQFIDDHPNMEEPLARIIFKQLAEAIAYCHHNHIAHRDIKEENVLINQSLQLRLIDFGSATFLEKAGDEEFKLFFGTLEYASPEVLSGKPYKGMQNDIWAMGVTLYSMIYTENPFFEVNETLSGVLHPPFEASLDAQDLIQGMLCVNPNLRYTIDDVIGHPWLNPFN